MPFANLPQREKDAFFSLLDECVCLDSLSNPRICMADQLHDDGIDTSPHVLRSSGKEVNRESKILFRMQPLTQPLL